MSNFNTQMLPAQVTGRGYIPVQYPVTAPAAGVPLRIPNKEATSVSAPASRAKEKKEINFDRFPKLEGFF